MRKSLLKLLASGLIVCMASFTAFADQPPDPGGGPGGEDPVGGGSPIGGGLVVLASLGVAYGAKKTFKLRKILK